MNTVQQLTGTATGEICPAYATVEQGIPAKHHTVSKQADSTQGMTRGVKNPKMQVAHVYRVSTLE